MSGIGTFVGVACIIHVVDANGDPIQGASVVFDGGSSLPNHKITDVRGEALFSIVEQGPKTVFTIFHMDYVRESVTFTDEVVHGAYNNPLVERLVSPSADQITLTVRLGRWSSAPIRLLSPRELVDLAKKSTDLRACVVEEINNGTQLSYRDTHLYGRPTFFANTTLTPATMEKGPGKPDAPLLGWERFNCTSLYIDPTRHGRLFWIESKQSAASSQALSAIVWSPNLTSKTSVASLDVIFFYCPSTGKQVAAYPYGLVMFKNDWETADQARPDQSYMSVGSRYLQKEHGMIYPLIARKSNAVIIMPINRKGAWDPFTAQEGVWRLCKEVCLFLHRECRTSSLGEAALAGERTERCGGSLRAYGVDSPEAKDFGPPPSIRKLVVSYFSAGSNGAQSCLDFWSLEDALVREGARKQYGKEITSDNAAAKFSAKLWGCNNPMSILAPTMPSSAANSLSQLDPKSAFTQSWTELWDIDGFRGGAWPYYLAQLKRWVLEGNGKRVIRLCHSDGRRPRRPMQPGGDADDKQARLWKVLLGERFEKVVTTPVDREHYKRLPIEEIYGDRFSIVALDAAYMEVGKTTPPDQFPQLLEGKDPVHHATFKLGWSHCVALSDVGKDL